MCVISIFNICYTLFCIATHTLYVCAYVCMYVCEMYMYITCVGILDHDTCTYIHTYVHTHVCMYIYIYIYNMCWDFELRHTYMNVCTYVCTYICIKLTCVRFSCLHVNIAALQEFAPSTPTPMYVCMYVFKYVCVCIYINTHTQTCIHDLV